MKHLQSFAVVIISCLIGFSSCNKGELLPSASNRQKVVYVDGVSSKDGIPIYKDWSQFYGHMNSANTLTKLTAFESKYNYRSLLGEYYLASTQPQYVESSSLIFKTKEGIILEAVDYGIAAMVNKEGFAIIGAGIYRFKGDKLYSLSVTESKLSDCLEMLSLTTPTLGNSNVRVSSYNDKSTSPNDKKNILSTPSTVVSGSQEYGNGYGIFRMEPKLHFGSWTQESFSCPYGLVYDDDAREYVCAGPMVSDGVYTQASISVTNVILKRSCGNCSNSVAQGYILSNQAVGYFNYQYNGSSSNLSVNTTSYDYNLYTQLFYAQQAGNSINFDVYGASVTFTSYLKDPNYGYSIGNFATGLNY